jgi:hypothetical protein
MVQTIKGMDKFESQLFQWDAKRQVILLPRGKPPASVCIG